MPTNTRLVYDEDTGEVVHVHVEEADLGTPDEEIAKMVPPGYRRLSVLTLPSDEVASGPIRVEGSELREADLGTAMAGAGVVRFAEGNRTTETG